MDTFRDVIFLWPSLAAFADDIDVKYVTAQAMYRRDNIPSEYWDEVVASATKRGFLPVTLSALSKLAAGRRAAQRVRSEPLQA